jgi:hypothetical protein
MESRDLPEVVKATFGVGSPLSVKLLTSVTSLHEKHSISCPISTSTSASVLTHSILRFASQNYYRKSQITDPNPCLTRGSGQH